MQRRDFLLSLGALALAGCGDEAVPPEVGDLGGASADLGHRLRQGQFPTPSETRKTEVLIIGGGVSGLSAAWWLNKAGRGDFQMLEMESQPGGNARAGANATTAYPLGAHYLPLPPPEAVYVRQLLAELGVLRGDPNARLPSYDERYLCIAPQERLYRNGLWEEGLMPRAGISHKEREQQKQFQQRMEALKTATGRDGRRAFALPMALSSRDPAWRALDGVSFRDWLLAEGFDAPSIHWLANYACRDDYGTTWDQTSAWAGIHYFASRSGGAEGVSGEVVLTAPEGNTWLVQGLGRHAQGRIQSGAMVYGLAQQGRGVEALVYLPREGRSVRYQARQAIWAAPLFLLPRVWAAMSTKLATLAREIDYAPWLVVNLHIKALPEPRGGAPLAWDNVLYDSAGLGYVVATHQHWRYTSGSSVLTYYRAMSHAAPGEARRQLLETPAATWAAAALTDLAKPHPDLPNLVSRIDITRYGHAMAQPRVGTVWGREALRGANLGPIHLAHADLSGFSLFEEAQYRGVLAAEGVLKG